MSHKRIGFAIVGYGLAAKLHAQALARLDEAELIAMVGRNVEKAKETADSFGVEALSLDEALKREDIQAFIVTTPTGSHLEVVREVAPRGKHLLVEKPLESSLQRTDELIRTCEEAGVILGAVFQHRYDDASLTLREYQERGLLGKGVMGSAYVKWYRPQEYYEARSWRGRVEASGGGALATQASHSIDLLLWFLGEAEKVCGFMNTLAHTGIEVEDVAVASIQFKNGALGSVEASTATYPGFPEKLELHFERGSAIIQGGKIVYLDTLSDEIPHVGQGESGSSGASDPAAVDIQPFVRMLRDFVNALREGKNPSLDGREGRRAVELIEAARKSALEGRVIELPL
ncbi:MAG: UDP-N-acetyl-2-amino-2-deoxyglucuronate dehydrogenase [Candidatus Atribacteria bacterium]|nr:UDP-N-acetyl-2-amino-2-deoxyglucuronate dehydrogenase [Candidatus Atribacteria bacterium]